MTLFNDPEVTLPSHFSFCWLLLSERNGMGLFDVTSLGTKIEINMAFSIWEHAEQVNLFRLLRAGSLHVDLGHGKSLKVVDAMVVINGAIHTEQVSIARLTVVVIGMLTIILLVLLRLVVVEVIVMIVAILIAIVVVSR